MPGAVCVNEGGLEGFEQDQPQQDRRLSLLLALFDALDLALNPALFDVAVDEGLHKGISAGGCIVSKMIESLRGDLVALQEAGAISKVTLRKFDAICPPPVREFGAADIKRLREGLKFSQPVFALHLTHSDP